jgi:hypothetical protein
MKADLPLYSCRAERDRLRPIADLDRQIEVLENPAEQRKRDLHLDLDVEHLPKGKEKATLQGREGDDVADRQRALPPVICTPA